VSGGPSRYELASIWSRWLARIVDGVLMLPLVVLDIVVRHPHTETVLAPGAEPITRVVSRHRPAWVLAVELLVPAVYEIVFVAVRGQTIGKMVAGVKIVMNDDADELPGLGLAAVRYVVGSSGEILRLLAGPLALVSIIDLLYALIDDRNRCVHDLAAGTVVVRARRGRQPMVRPPDEPSIVDIDLSRLRRDPPFPPSPPSLS
jgi:uncharacterized RDD family membrane protein YckC